MREKNCGLQRVVKDTCYLQPICPVYMQMVEALTRETAIVVKQVAAWCLAAAAASARASSRGHQTSNRGGEKRDCVWGMLSMDTETVYVSWVQHNVVDEGPNYILSSASPWHSDS